MPERIHYTICVKTHPPDLLERCITYIAKNINVMQVYHSTKNILNGLPSFYLNKLLQCYLKGPNGSCQDIDAFLGPSLTIFKCPAKLEELKSLSPLGDCANISTLDLSGQRAIKPQDITELLMKLPHLTSLNLKYTECTDAVLQAISDHNQELTELNASCTNVGDEGVGHLCSLDNSGMLKCKTLRQLFISPTKVTTSGLELILTHLNCEKLGPRPECFIRFIHQ